MLAAARRPGTRRARPRSARTARTNAQSHRQAKGPLVSSPGRWPTRSRSRCPTDRSASTTRARRPAEIAASIGKRLAKDGARRQGRRRMGRPRPPDRARRRRHDRHPRLARRARGAPPLDGACHGAGGHRPVSREREYAIGPAIADGFYYDFELPDGRHFTDDDLERIEARMREIVAADQPFVREEVDSRRGPARSSPTSPTRSRSSSGSSPMTRRRSGRGP